MFIGLVETHAKEVTAFYFRPSKTKFAFDKVAVGINSLNKIFSGKCARQQAINAKPLTVCVLLVFPPCSMLGLKKIDTRKVGHRSNALYQYDKPTDENVSKVSNIFGPCVVSTSTCTTTEEQDESIALKDVVVQKEKFKNCTINVTVSKKEYVPVLL